MNKIAIRVLIIGLLIFCFKSFAQVPVEIHNSTGAIGALNPFPVTFSGTVGTSTTLVRKESSQDLSAGALNYTTNFAAKTKVLQVFLHASTNISETVTISFNSTTGANYDTVIKSETLSSAANIAWIPDNFVLLSGDEVTVTCTNGGGTGTVYVTIVGETLN